MAGWYENKVDRQLPGLNKQVRLWKEYLQIARLQLHKEIE